MLIGDKYKVDSDGMNLILWERTENKDSRERVPTKKDKNPGWKAIGFFYSFANLMDHMVENNIMGVGFEDLKAIADRQAELHRLIQTLPLYTISTKKSASQF